MDNKSCCSNIDGDRSNESVLSPQKLIISYFDYIKMFLNWLLLFRKKPYILKPGLYYTGEEYKKNTPLLVTCNFLSTIVLLYRGLKSLNVRLLVVDTGGINVWCSSGKGRFSAEEIISKLNLYDRDLFSDSDKIEVILPKLSLSGVRLSVLRKNKINPVIGPIYAKRLKQYLGNPPYQDCVDDVVHFGLKARAYTVVPTMVQLSWYAMLMAVPLLIFDAIFKTGFHWQVIPIAIIISFLYPILFPWLPGKLFAVKGISLALILSLGVIYFAIFRTIPLTLAFFYVAFIAGTSIFFALSYTGNSAVSNYSKVKREIVYFLPLSILFYIVALAFYFINGRTA